MAINTISKYLVLDVYQHDKTPETIKAIAADNDTRYIAAEIRNNGDRYDVTDDSIVTLLILRPDGVGVGIAGEPRTLQYESPGSFDPDTGITTPGETVTHYGVYAELDQAALAISGTLLGQFKITNGEQILRTQLFHINNGRALDTETSDWSGEYQGYNLDELVQSVNSAVATVTEMETDVSELKSGLSDLLNSAFVTDSASGGVAHFEDGADNIPMKSLKVNIVPVQSGSGYPSPSNVRPISGWDSVKVMKAGKNLLDSSLCVERTAYGATTTVNIDGSISLVGTTTGASRWWSPNDSLSFPLKAGTYTASPNNMIISTTTAGNKTGTFTLTEDTVINNVCFVLAKGQKYNEVIYPQLEAGSSATAYEPFGDTYTTALGRTVYGGTLDVVSGELVVDMATVDLGSLTWSYQSATSLFYSNGFPSCKNNTTKLIFSNREWAPESSQAQVSQTDKSICKDSNGCFYVHDSSYNATADFQSAMSGSMMCYELATPITYNLTPTEVKSLLGVNNIWSDAGDVEVEYRADTKLYIDKRLAEVTA